VEAFEEVAEVTGWEVGEAAAHQGNVEELEGQIFKTPIKATPKQIKANMPARATSPICRNILEVDFCALPPSTALDSDMTGRLTAC
jgi:hypothetical protein